MTLNNYLTKCRYMIKKLLPSRRESGGMFVVLRQTLAIMAFVAGASFCFAGTRWHSQASFYYINHLPIPWWVYGSLLLVAGACLWFKKTRPFGYIIGGIVYTFFGIGAWLAVLGGLHSSFLWLAYLNFPHGIQASFFGACNITTIAVLYWSAAKYAVYEQVDPDRHIVEKIS